MRRKATPLHDYWHRRVDGQIRDCMFHHPEWFNASNETERLAIINSIAKRIVGEIVAERTLATVRGEMIAACVPVGGHVLAT